MSFNFWLGILAGTPLGAVTSQSFLDLMITLLFLGWIYQYARAPVKVNHRINWIGIEWAFIGYLAVIGAGYIFNASSDAEIAWSMKKFVWIPHLYIFIYSFQQVQLKRFDLIKYFTFVFLLPNIYALATYVAGYDFVTGTVSQRIIGLVDSATYHAHANAIVFVFFSAILFLSYQKLSQKQKIVSLISYTLFAVSIFLTFTRGIWISIILSALLMFALFSYKSGLKILLAVCGVATICYFTWPQFNERIQHSLSIEKNHERADLFMANYQIWHEYPLLGIGYGENKRRIREYWDRLGMPEDYIISHAHNQFLNVLASTGVLGLIFFLYIFSFFLKTNWQLIKKTDRVQTPIRFMLLFACLWTQSEFILACLSDVSFEYAKIRDLILIVWALVIALKIKPEIACEEGPA